MTVKTVQAAVAKKRTAVKTVTGTVAVSAADFVYVMERMTKALEKVEAIGGDAKSEVEIEPRYELRDEPLPGKGCPPKAGPGVQSLVGVSLDIARELFAMTCDMRDRLRGAQVEAENGSALRPSCGPMKDGIESVNGLMHASLANLR